MQYDIEKIRKAWEWATRAHKGQTYGGSRQGEKIVYINHIGSVFMEVSHALSRHPEYDAGLALLCAVLHDTVEDTSITINAIENEFGKRVADGVGALTKNENLPTKQEQMEDSLDRIKQQPKEIWMVKMADRICNLTSPPYYWDDFKKEKYRKEAMMIYHELKEGNSTLAERLKDKIIAYGKFIGS